MFLTLRHGCHENDFSTLRLQCGYTPCKRFGNPLRLKVQLILNRCTNVRLPWDWICTPWIDLLKLCACLHIGVATLRKIACHWYVNTKRKIRLPSDSFPQFLLVPRHVWVLLPVYQRTIINNKKPWNSLIFLIYLSFSLFSRVPLNRIISSIQK